MKYQSRKRDLVEGFQIPIHKQQLRIIPGITQERVHYKQHHRRPRRPKGNGTKKKRPCVHVEKEKRHDIGISYYGYVVIDY